MSLNCSTANKLEFSRSILEHSKHRWRRNCRFVLLFSAAEGENGSKRLNEEIAGDTHIKKGFIVDSL